GLVELERRGLQVRLEAAERARDAVDRALRLARGQEQIARLLEQTRRERRRGERGRELLQRVERLLGEPRGRRAGPGRGGIVREQRVGELRRIRLDPRGDEIREAERGRERLRGWRGVVEQLGHREARA